MKQLVSQMSRDKQLNNRLFSAPEHHAIDADFAHRALDAWAHGEMTQREAIDADFAHRVLDAWVHGEITRREAIEELITVGASAREAIRIIREIERCGWEV